MASKPSHSHDPERGALVAMSGRVLTTDSTPPRHMLEPPRHPHGWFAPLRSSDVTRERPTPFSFMGHELVAFRDEEGRVAVLDAICPHFGAHLGHGGEIVKGCIRCPFHKLDFDRDGQCQNAMTHYDSSRLRHLRTRSWACRERFGMIFVWHGADRSKPAWEMPLDTLDWDGWTEPLTNEGLPMPGVEPLWVAENIADVVHFTTVHCWEVDVVKPPREDEDGSYRIVVDATWRLGARSKSPRLRALGSLLSSTFRLDLRIVNPGVVVAEATLTEAQGGFTIRTVILVNPVGEHDSHLRVLVSVRRKLGKRLFGIGPEELFSHLFLAIGTDDFRSDAAIWRHRRHLTAPILLKGDGPLIDFRRWSTRFWPDTEAQPARGARRLAMAV